MYINFSKINFAFNIEKVRFKKLFYYFHIQNGSFHEKITYNNFIFKLAKKFKTSYM